MPNTSEDLAAEALGIVNVLQAGQDPNPEDLAYVLKVIPRLVAQVGIGGVVYVGDADDIDDAIFLPLAGRLALEIGPRFGLPAVDKATKVESDATLRALAGSKPSGFPVKVDYF